MNELDTAIFIVQQLQNRGFVAYFAGGWVRDYLMGRSSDDIDIATSAPIEMVRSIFPKTVAVGIAFGIVIVLHEGHRFEVATFRKDRPYLDGRHPSGIVAATPEEDALRRDFTMNGMFYDPIEGQIYDFVHGREDITDGVIRAIGDPLERIGEDRLRMMRAVRYATRFGFSIEEATREAILAYAATLRKCVAIERIWQEIQKMSEFSHLDRGIVALHQLSLLSSIFPSLHSSSLEEVEALVRYIPHFPKETPVIGQIMELFPEASLPFLCALCEDLKLARWEKNFVEFYHRYRRVLFLPGRWEDRLELVEWAYFYAHRYSGLILQMVGAHFSSADREIFFHAHATKRKELGSAVARITDRTPVVRAEHLLAAGVARGRQLGFLLKEAERIAINSGVDHPQAVIHQLKKRFLF